MSLFDIGTELLFHLNHIFTFNYFQRKTSFRKTVSKVADAKALWSNKFEAYAAKQASNPFSDKYVGPAKIDKSDPNYGR